MTVEDQFIPLFIDKMKVELQWETAEFKLDKLVEMMPKLVQGIKKVLLEFRKEAAATDLSTDDDDKKKNGANKGADENSNPPAKVNDPLIQMVDRIAETKLVARCIDAFFEPIAPSKGN